MKSILRQSWQALSLIVIGAHSMSATADQTFPGYEPDRLVAKTQEKADALFEKGDYARALFIYKEDLVPNGDKFAQYMVGYMHLTGKGVPQDVTLASAWYRLAAERNDDVFTGARDELLSMLNEDQRTQSDSSYGELRRTFSDAALLSGLIRQDLVVLRRYTDSRPSTMRSFEETFDNRKSVYSPVVDRIEGRLEYLLTLTLLDEFDPEIESDDVDLLEQEVQAEIEDYKQKSNSSGITR